MYITKDKKKWICAVILLICACSIFCIRPLWYVDTNIGHEANFTENTYGIVASNESIISQSFVAQENYLESILILMVRWEETNDTLPYFTFADKNENIIVESQCYWDPSTNMLKIDIYKKIKKGDLYTVNISFENTENYFSTYFTSIESTDAQNICSIINGSQTDSVLFAWYNYKSNTFELLWGVFAILTLGCILLFSFHSPIANNIINGIGIICCVFLCINAVNRLGNVHLNNMYVKSWIITTFLLLLLMVIFTIITRHLNLGIIIPCAICFLYGLIAHYVMEFRGTVFLPIDILAFNTAKNVAANYTYKIDATIMLSIISFMAIVFFSINRKKRINYNIYISTIIVISLSLICISLFTPLNTKKLKIIPYYYMQEEGNLMYGPIVNFLTNIQSCFHTQPKDYSMEHVSKISDFYTPTPSPNMDTEFPNIIVIMNESWADINFSNKLGLTESFMPNIEKISKEENALLGNTVVPARGGGTNLTEFSFLTGSVIDFGLTGSCYDLDCKEGVSSLVSALKDLGYYTIALHPAYSKNWNRDIGYQKLGFDSYIALEDLEPYTFDYPRSYRYVSDSSLYKVIYDITDNKNNENKPLFIFCITIQNHGDYNDKSYMSTVEVEDPQIAQYLSLIKETDLAYAELINHYRYDNRKTVILMFGDHWPALDNIYTLVESNSIECNTTPYIVWANSKINNLGAPPYYSVNYLQVTLFDIAELPLTGYQKFLKETASKYPITCCGKYIDAGGHQKSLFKSEMPSELNDYKIMQYNNLFDTENRNLMFYHINFEESSYEKSSIN